MVHSARALLAARAGRLGIVAPGLADRSAVQNRWPGFASRPGVYSHPALLAGAASWLSPLLSWFRLLANHLPGPFKIPLGFVFL